MSFQHLYPSHALPHVPLFAGPADPVTAGAQVPGEARTASNASGARLFEELLKRRDCMHVSFAADDFDAMHLLRIAV